MQQRTKVVKENKLAGFDGHDHFPMYYWNIFTIYWYGLEKLFFTSPVPSFSMICHLCVDYTFRKQTVFRLEGELTT